MIIAELIMNQMHDVGEKLLEIKGLNRHLPDLVHDFGTLILLAEFGKFGGVFDEQAQFFADDFEQMQIFFIEGVALQSDDIDDADRTPFQHNRHGQFGGRLLEETRLKRTGLRVIQQDRAILRIRRADDAAFLRGNRVALRLDGFHACMRD